MNKLLSRMVPWCLLFFMSVAVAKDATGIGAVAQNMMEPVGLASNFVFTGCYVIGASFIFSSIIKYNEHRRSPLMVSLGTVFFLLFAGIFLIALPFTYMLTQSGAPHHLMKQS